MKGVLIMDGRDYQRRRNYGDNRGERGNNRGRGGESTFDVQRQVRLEGITKNLERRGAQLEGRANELAARERDLIITSSEVRNQLTRLADRVEAGTIEQRQLDRQAIRYGQSRRNLDNLISRHNMAIDNFARDVDSYNQDVNTHIAEYPAAGSKLSTFETYDLPGPLGEAIRRARLKVSLTGASKPEKMLQMCMKDLPVDLEATRCIHLGMFLSKKISISEDKRGCSKSALCFCHHVHLYKGPEPIYYISSSLSSNVRPR